MILKLLFLKFFIMQQKVYFVFLTIFFFLLAMPKFICKSFFSCLAT